MARYLTGTRLLCEYKVPLLLREATTKAGALWPQLRTRTAHPPQSTSFRRGIKSLLNEPVRAETDSWNREERDWRERERRESERSQERKEERSGEIEFKIPSMLSSLLSSSHREFFFSSLVRPPPALSLGRSVARQPGGLVLLSAFQME